MPPVGASHQLIVPPLDDAARFTVPASHLVSLVVPVIVGVVLTVPVTAVLDAVVHPLAVAST